MKWYRFSKHQIKGVHELSLQIFNEILNLDIDELTWDSNGNTSKDVYYYTGLYDIPELSKPIRIKFVFIDQNTAYLEIYKTEYCLVFSKSFLHKAKSFIKFNIIAHEVSHLIEADKFNKSFMNKNIDFNDMDLDHKNKDFKKNYERYINQPTEIKAIIQEIYYEIIQNINIKHKGDLLYLINRSSKFQDVYNYLTLENRKKILQGLYYKFSEENLDNSDIINHELFLQEKRNK